MSKLKVFLSQLRELEEEVRAAVAGEDWERAHAALDKLWEKTLVRIEEGDASQAAPLARRALAMGQIVQEKWCA